MIVFDEPHHLIFNESVEKITESIVKKMNEYVSREKITRKELMPYV